MQCRLSHAVRWSNGITHSFTHSLTHSLNHSLTHCLNNGGDPRTESTKWIHTPTGRGPTRGPKIKKEKQKYASASFHFLSNAAQLSAWITTCDMVGLVQQRERVYRLTA
mmetsp:Transcript_25812/g.50546  ORF Transcript_25812/g.50546 Transcript_25812/m.50546 type:complete len:109 (-) Transcript_25812:383-709(-)